MLDGSLIQSSYTFKGLTVGNHTITVTDTNGCIKTISFTIPFTDGGGLILNLVSKSDVSCIGGNDGFIKVIASGGTPGYTYMISKNSRERHYVLNNKFFNLRAGTYTVFAKDANNNIAQIVVVINDGLVNCKNTITSINNLSINPYPNPSNREFNISIQTDSDEDILVEVFDIFGKKVYQSKAEKFKTIRLGAEFKPGSYFVRVIQGAKTVTKEIIKQ